jgi:cell division transport system permease protein
VAAVIRHAFAEGWLLLMSRRLVSVVLAVALAIPISAAGVTASIRHWLNPVAGLSDQDIVVAVLLHPRMHAEERQQWIAGQAVSHPEWRLVEVSPEDLARRLRSWFPYLEEVLAREGPEMLPPMVEITTSEPRKIQALESSPEVLAVGPTSSVHRVVGGLAKRLSTVLFLLAGALIAGAVLLAAIWIHLELHRHADEIAIMRMMGATEATVRGPFLVAVAAPALLAAVLSVIGTVSIVGWMTRLAAPFGLTAFSSLPPVVLVGQVLGAVGLPIAAAFLTLERHAAADE